MRGLTDRELIAVWDRGRGRAVWYRGVLPVAAVVGVPPADVLDWPVGRRDAWLLAVRAWTIGPTLDAVGRCPVAACRQRVELTVPVETLLAALPADAEPQAEVEAGGWAVTVRSPTSSDMAAADRDRLSPAELLQRCVLAARPITPDAPDEPPAGAATAAEQAIERLDPLAVIELAMRCPECDAAWTEVLNVVDYVWAELETAVRRLLRDVHELASAYGWTEGEILGLDRTRRRLYREMIRARG